MTDEEPTYCIKRFFHPSLKKENEAVKEGLTLQEAKDHCADPESHTDEYFDGFEKE
jgi:hypothetical protein